MGQISFDHKTQEGFSLIQYSLLFKPAAGGIVTPTFWWVPLMPRISDGIRWLCLEALTFEN